MESSRIPYDIESKVEHFHWWFVGRRKLLHSILMPLKVSKSSIAVEVGCGTGANLRTLGSAGLYTIGVDRSTYALKLVRSKDELPLLAGDLNNLPFKTKSVGLIIAMDILEHLEDDGRGINESYRVLKKNGLLIITVPAFNFLWGIQDAVTGHKRRYSRTEIKGKLEAAGFNVLRSSYFNFFLFFPILIARRVIKLLDLKIRSENVVNSSMLNFVLKPVFSVEPYLLKYFSFPIGVSIFCLAQK
jgi:SAM-dependent methyltransferase